jgi:hypothetical protein
MLKELKDKILGKSDDKSTRSGKGGKSSRKGAKKEAKKPRKQHGQRASWTR